MQDSTTFAGGYKVADEQSRERLNNRILGGMVILEVNELLNLKCLAYRETEHTDDDGNVILSYRVVTDSSTRGENGRLLPLDAFNPYPIERTELLAKSRFFTKVAEFQGSVNDFIDWLINDVKVLKVVGSERMSYIPFGKKEPRSKVFYILDFAE